MACHCIIGFDNTTLGCFVTIRCYCELLIMIIYTDIYNDMEICDYQVCALWCEGKKFARTNTLLLPLSEVSTGLVYQTWANPKAAVQTVCNWIITLCSYSGLSLPSRPHSLVVSMFYDSNFP